MTQLYWPKYYTNQSEIFFSKKKALKTASRSEILFLHFAIMRSDFAEDKQGSFKISKLVTKIPVNLVGFQWIILIVKIPPPPIALSIDDN